MAGPYTILSKEGHPYRLDLPDSMKVHKVFSPDKLRKAPDNPVPSQKVDPPPPIVIAADTEFEVQDILASKIVRKEVRYKVRWIGYEDDPVWYYCRDVMYAPPTKLEAFTYNTRMQPVPRRTYQNGYRIGKRVSTITTSYQVESLWSQVESRLT